MKSKVDYGKHIQTLLVNVANAPRQSSTFYEDKMKTISIFLLTILTLSSLSASEVAERIIKKFDIQLFPELTCEGSECHSLPSSYSPEQIEELRKRGKKAQEEYNQLMVGYLSSKFTEEELAKLEALLADPLVEKFSNVMNFQLEDGEEAQARLTEISSRVYEGIQPQQVEPGETLNSEAAPLN